MKNDYLYMKKIASSVTILIAIIFLSFVIVQYNDPDPINWMIAYGFVCVVSILAFLNKLNKNVFLISMPLYLAGAIYSWPETFEGVTMGMGYKPHVELARESLGLLIAFFSLVYLYFYAKKTKI
jgi:hypothetical protein